MGSAKASVWMKWAMGLAGVYNLVWAVWMTARPAGLYEWLGVAVPSPVSMVQWLGFLIGVMGVGYLVAATNPVRHWGLVLVGLMSKTGGALGTVGAVEVGELPAKALWLAAVNDIVWLAPFAMILTSAYRQSMQHRRSLSPEILRMALRRRTNQGVTLEEMSALSPVLVVFLRHAGCTFCREALGDLARMRRQIEAQGARLTLVHMGSEEQGERFFKRYGLEDVPRVSDQERTLYRAFGLPRGRMGDLFGPKVWWRGFQAGILGRHGVGMLVGDGFQMPGVFLLFHGEVLRSYRHQSAADRPDYMALVTGREYVAREFSA